MCAFPCWELSSDIKNTPIDPWFGRFKLYQNLQTNVPLYVDRSYYNDYQPLPSRCLTICSHIQNTMTMTTAVGWDKFVVLALEEGKLHLPRSCWLVLYFWSCLDGEPKTSENLVRLWLDRNVSQSMRIRRVYLQTKDMPHCSCRFRLVWIPSYVINYVASQIWVTKHNSRVWEAITLRILFILPNLKLVEKRNWVNFHPCKFQHENCSNKRDIGLQMNFKWVDSILEF